MVPASKLVDLHLILSKRTHIDRTRKVKCDEGRPVCQRCISTSRVCDGYGIWGGGGNSYGDRYAKKPDTVMPEPVSVCAVSSAEERTHLEWFTFCAVRKSPGVFSNEFWKAIVLKASLEEPAILHATLAFSCAHRAYQSSVYFSPDRQPDSQEQFILRHYGKAITSLRPHFAAQTKASIRVTLVTCVLFICLDLIRGYHNSGLEHLRNGSRLLNQLRPTILAWVEQPRDSAWTFTAGTVERTLADILGKFCFQAVLLGQRSSFDVGALLHPLPESFKSANAAQSHLIILLHSVTHLTEMGRLLDRTNSILYSQLVRFKDRAEAQLASWSIAWNISGSRINKQPGPLDHIAHHLLRSHHLLATIKARTCLRPYDEMIYDSYTDDFESIVDQSVQLVQLVASHALDDTAFKFHQSHAQFTSDMGWLPPLYYTSLKCRNTGIRHHAIELIRSTPSREGFWDANVAASVAEFVIGLEEMHPVLTLNLDWLDAAEMQSDSEASQMVFPPEHQRLSDVRIDLANSTQGTVRVRYSRRTQTDELVTCTDEVFCGVITGQSATGK